MFKPRPAQEAVLAYSEGTMGIAAVPGSGKTWTLSQLAASLIINGHVPDGQEVLIVTLVNSAVDNFKKRIAFFLEQQGYLSGTGYRVRTLHSLAREIVAKVPSSVGLANDFSVVDERIGESILQGAFRATYPRYESFVHDYLVGDLSAFRRKKIETDDLPKAVQMVMRSAISHLKNKEIYPSMLREKMVDDVPVLVHMIADVYERYQHGLATRGALDFDDLISMALRCLDNDESLVDELRTAWPYVLEDEAQDSSALQEAILRKLVGENGNWVRVGDPNQAIYETFTTAHPRYLKEFLEEATARRNLPNSGRSGRPIINLANELIRWVNEEHPVTPLRGALSVPYIEPTPPGDPQPNPADEECRLALDYRGDDQDAEKQRVVKSLKKWLPEHPDTTVAVLVPTHAHGAELVKIFDKEHIPYSDALLRLTTSTREAAGALSSILQHLAHPSHNKSLPIVYRIWFYRVMKRQDNDENKAQLDQHLAWLSECSDNEALIWPTPGNDWLLEQKEHIPEAFYHLFAQFREHIQRWHGLVLLPIGELLTALAQDLFDEPEKLAMTQVFGDLLNERIQFHLGADQRMLTLDDLQKELVVIAKDQRRLRSIEADKSGFDPEEHKGEVVIATMHGAKGLEWDRVYLLSLNDYEFPSGHATDQFRAERWFVRDSLSMEAELLAQLDAVLEETEYTEGEATQEARYDYARERLRLLYVGITRARKELMITSSTGRGKNKPAEAFYALQRYIEDIHASQ